MNGIVVNRPCVAKRIADHYRQLLFPTFEHLLVVSELALSEGIHKFTDRSALTFLKRQLSWCRSFYPETDAKTFFFIMLQPSPVLQTELNVAVRLVEQTKVVDPNTFRLGLFKAQNYLIQLAHQDSHFFDEYRSRGLLIWSLCRERTTQPFFTEKNRS